MATWYEWNPFGVALEVTASANNIKRISATQYSVTINASWKAFYEGAKTNYGMKATSGGTTKIISGFNGSTKYSSGSTSFTGTYSISGNGAATKTIPVVFTNYNDDNNDSKTYTVNLSVSVPALTSYKVSYNANGGSGAPSAQTKWKDQTLTLSSTKPTRSKYNFKGWGISASATTVSYASGASYTKNAAITLYAVWELAYVKPRINNLSVERCTSDGTLSSEGTYAKVTFDWTTDETVSSIVVKRKSATETSWVSTNVSASGKSGSSSIIIGSGALATDTSYTVSVTITDALGENTASRTLPSQFFTIDIRDDGNGVSFGGEATERNTFINNFNQHQVGNSYCYQPIAFNGDKGYTLLATIQIIVLNADAPITFEIVKRQRACPMRVHVRFNSSSSTLDPTLASVTYDGDNYGAFLSKTAESTWNLYVDNTTGWSNPCVTRWYTSQSNGTRISVTFPSEQVTELPEPWYRATPVMMQSILDYIYPVGSVYISYSHNNPATMFGGTWVRIENAFLWATDASGTIGQTGGEAEHTLTTNELPAHGHTISVANTASGDLTAANKIRYNGSATSYLGTLSTNTAGSGAAHNNMPPYIQVSVWRRTA